MNHLKAQHQHILGKKTELQNETKRIEKKISTIHTNINTIEADLQRHRQEFGTYENQKSEIVGNINTMNVDITRQDRAIVEHRERINQNQIQLNKKFNEQQVASNNVERIKQKIQLIKRDLGEKENEEKSKKREIAHEEKLLESQKLSVADLEQQIQSQQGKLAEVKQQSDTNKSEIDVINGKIQQLQDDKVQLEQKRVDYAKKNPKTRRTLSKNTYTSAAIVSEDQANKRNPWKTT